MAVGGEVSDGRVTWIGDLERGNGAPERRPELAMQWGNGEYCAAAGRRTAIRGLRSHGAGEGFAPAGSTETHAETNRSRANTQPRELGQVA